LNKGTEPLEAYTKDQLLASVSEYSEKPYVLAKYLESILQRKKFKKDIMDGYLSVIEAYLEPLKEDKFASLKLKIALQIIENNMKPGNKEYD
jgi:hypothetical protein